MRIAVLGAGYVGLVTGACLSNIGHVVHVFDVDRDRIAGLQSGHCPIFEPGLDEIIEKNHRFLQFRNLTEVSSFDAYYIAVGTPPDEDGNADMSQVLAAAKWIDSARDRSVRSLVVIKSTVPPGTAARVKGVFGDSDGVAVVSNPEFLKEGTAIKDFTDPDRIVVGASSREDCQKVVDIYSQSGIAIEKFFLVSNASAELAKYANNGMLATRISFMNEMSRIAHDVGASIDDVRDVLGADSRIGPSFLSAGPGWGGSCFPKDLSALSMMAGDPDAMPLVSAAIETNELQTEYVAKRIMGILGPLAHRKTLTMWGLAFKPGTDDMRCSPAVELLKILGPRVGKVQVHDPVALATEEMLELGNIEQVEFRDDSVKGAHLLVIATDWPCYGLLDWEAIAMEMSGTDVFDSRNIVREPLLEHGLRLYRL